MSSESESVSAEPIGGTAPPASWSWARAQARAYDEVYGWHVTVGAGALDAAGGAGTAGPPPYDVYRLAPETAYGFGTDRPITSTRWRFAENSAGR